MPPLLHGCFEIGIRSISRDGNLSEGAVKDVKRPPLCSQHQCWRKPLSRPTACVFRLTMHLREYSSTARSFVATPLTHTRLAPLRHCVASIAVSIPKRLLDQGKLGRMEAAQMMLEVRHFVPSGHQVFPCDALKKTMFFGFACRWRCATHAQAAHEGLLWTRLIFELHLHE